jgi:Ca-activated chloride channel family protein
MMKLIKKLFLFFLFSLFLTFSSALHAQQPVKKNRILFVLDASGSMWAKMDTTLRITMAKKLLTHIVDSLRKAPNLEIALRVYGHRSPPEDHDCQDTKLEVPFSPKNHDEIINVINGLTPKGTTLIAQSLLESGNDFPSSATSRNIIILITDGIEECKGDPCAVSEALQKKGIILKPFIIGLGANSDFQKAFECVGKYYDASTEGLFQNVLNVILSQALNATTAQVNLLDAYGNPTETNVNMSFYDSHTGALAYNYVHAILNGGAPDTVKLDPGATYKLVVHTIPPVEKYDINLVPGKHTIIPIDAPQGMLNVRIEGAPAYSNLQCVVKQAGSPEIIHLQPVNSTNQYLVGKYDLEILTLPRVILKDVQVTQSAVNPIILQQPGKVTIQSTQDEYAAIYEYKKNVLEWVTNIDVKIRNQTLVMQPGTYKIVYRPKLFNRSNYTFEKEFTITSGGLAKVTF